MRRLTPRGHPMTWNFCFGHAKQVGGCLIYVVDELQLDGEIYLLRNERHTFQLDATVNKLVFNITLLVIMEAIVILCACLNRFKTTAVL